MIGIYSAPAVASEKLLERVYNGALKHFCQRDIFYVEVTFVSPEDIRTVNRESRGVDSVTDVLSFPSLDKLELPVAKSNFSAAEKTDGGRVMLGEIVICTERMKEQATELGHSEERECAFLFLHGLLHLFGFDHIEEKDAEIMQGHAEAVLSALGINR